MSYVKYSGSFWHVNYVEYKSVGTTLETHYIVPTNKEIMAVWSLLSDIRNKMSWSFEICYNENRVYYEIYGQPKTSRGFIFR